MQNFLQVQNEMQMKNQLQMQNPQQNPLQMQNLHSHTTYCDGSLTPEEMVQAAIAKGCDSFGFSGHSYMAFDPKPSMDADETERYRQDVGRLREKFAGIIELFCGIEQEYYSEGPPVGFDYIIGSVHYLMKDGAYISVDTGAKHQQASVDEHYGGDYYAFAEHYYETMADIAKTNADIVGHFDIVTKFNADDSRFDTSHPRYIAAAIDAMGEVLKSCRLFEVNTGAVYRKIKREQYPSTFLLRELHKRGGEVILSSDSHDGESICWMFAEMRELLRSVGFKYVKYFTDDGFTDMRL